MATGVKKLTDGLTRLNDNEFKQRMAQFLEYQAQDRRENQLLYYKPNPKSVEIHRDRAKIVGIGGGNGSGKTENGLIEICMLATGIIPDSLREYPEVREKLRGPVNCRVVCESLTTTLHQIILAKLKWWIWTGVDQPGGERGHWGWIPRMNLVKGQWERSWSEKLRTLTVLYRDPDNPNKVVGPSTIQFMSHDQDPTDFASGDFHLVLSDEPPRLAIWTENEARTMRVNGRQILAMTWPDDPSIPVDWLFERIYEPAQPGPGKDPNISWYNLWTTDNPHLNQTAVAEQSARWTEEIRRVRIYGQPIRFSNRIHPQFTDETQTWCFNCGKPMYLVTNGECQCGSFDTAEYNHVIEFDPSPYWPTLFLIDPHPRKPHMMMWVQVDPNDDLWQVAEADIEEDCIGVRMYAERMEGEYGLDVKFRGVDPNMARSPSGQHRGITWQDEFSSAGLNLDLCDSSDVGRMRINEYLKPDPKTKTPRIHIHPRCQNTISQFKRYVWDDYRRSLEKDVKQYPKEKNDDYPTLWKYTMNLNPTFQFYNVGPRILRRRGGFEDINIRRR